MEYIALKDVCKINMGQSPESSSYNENGEGIPFFQGNADFGERYPVTRVWCNAPTQIANAGDILISVRAPIGALNYAKEECCIGRGLAAITPDPGKFSTEFIFWLLRGKNAELNSKGTGSTFKAIGRKVLEETLVPDYGFKQQHICAENLEKVYAIIQMRKQELLKLDELIKARFVEMFGDPISNDKGWNTDPLTTVCSRIYGGGTPSKSHPEYFEGSIPWVSPKDMKSDVITDSIDHITEEAIANSTTNLVPEGSVLMVIRSGILKHDLPVSINAVPVTINQDMKAFVPGENITASFLRNYFKAIELDVLAGVRGVTADNIDFKTFQQRKIIVPPIHLQEEFEDFCRQVDKSKVAVQQSLDETLLLFNCLMQKYFG